MLLGVLLLEVVGETDAEEVFVAVANAAVSRSKSSDTDNKLVRSVKWYFPQTLLLDNIKYFNALNRRHGQIPSLKLSDALDDGLVLNLHRLYVVTLSIKLPVVSIQPHSVLHLSSLNGEGYHGRAPITIFELKRVV